MQAWRESKGLSINLSFIVMSSSGLQAFVAEVPTGFEGLLYYCIQWENGDIIHGI
jgi:hypothetical protein